MIPHERSLVERLKDKPFVILGVNSDEKKQTLIDAQKKENITWRSFFEGSTSGPIATQFNVQGWPTVYLLDKDRKIRWKGHGSPDEKLLDQVIAEAEGKAPDPGSKAKSADDKAKSKSGE